MKPFSNNNNPSSDEIKLIPQKQQLLLKEKTSPYSYFFLALIIISLFIVFSIFYLYYQIKHNNVVYTSNSLIDVPISDYRHIRFISLKNGLEAILISDPLSYISGASLTVSSGANQDPIDTPGLAHFCEHMLFLGSKAYPDGDAYFKSVTENNGHFNAFTDREVTTFFFDVHYFSFEKTLDIFSHFFIDPLFNEEKVYKEINSVNSEYEKNLILDSRKRSQIYSYISKEDHEYHRFTTGNYETLIQNNTKILEKLKKYHDENYIANKMKLVIYSNDELDDLEYLVNTKFGDIKSNNSFDIYRENNITERYFDKMFTSPISNENLNSIILYDTIISDIDELKISFIQPPIIDRNNFNVNPYMYFKFILESKNPNSLSEILKNKGYISKLSVSNEKNFNTWSDLSLSLALTKKGYMNIKNILKITESFLTLIKEKHIRQEYYDYLNLLSQTTFQLQRISNDKLFQYLSKISTKMQKFPITQILNEYHTTSKWDNNTYNTLLRYSDNLSIKKSIMFLNRRSDYSSFNISSFANKIKDDYEPWYKTNFSLYKSTLTYGKGNLTNITFSPLSNSNVTKLKELLSNVKECKEECLNDIIQSEKIKPRIINKEINFEIWVKNISSIQNNKIKTGIKLLYNITNTNDILYLNMLEFYLKKKTKKIQTNLKLYSNSLNIYYNTFGINIDYLVDSSQLENTTEEIISKVNNLLYSKSKFKNYKLFIQELIRKFTKQDNSQPYYQSFEEIQKIAFNTSYLSTKEIISLLNDNLTSSESNFTSFINNFKERFHISIILVGSLLQTSDKSIIHLFCKIKPAINNVPLKQKYLAQIDLSQYYGNYLIKNVSTQENNRNNVLTKCYYVNKVNYKDEILIELINSIIGNLIFRELRINKQFGYIAKSKIKNFNNNYVYYYITIISSIAYMFKALSSYLKK